MPCPWIIDCRDEEHAAGEAARVVLDAFVRAGERDFALALSGGRIAPTFFAALIRESRRRRSPLDLADFFWADERCTPPDHPESNYRVARTHLLEPLGVELARVHRIPGELTPAEAARRASDDWLAGQRRGGDGEASLDCLVLGVGEDGHVASLFPGNLAADLAADRPPFRAVVGPKPPPDRITMGYPMLWNASLLVVLAPGNGKREIVQASLRGTSATPLHHVLRLRSERRTAILLSH